MEDLMGAAPDVECSRETPLRPSSLHSQSVSQSPSLCESIGTFAPDRVESCAEDIHGAVDDDTGDAHPVLEPLVAVDSNAVDNRDEAG